MQWFGKTWLAPICATTEHITTPVGLPCFECGKPIEMRDRGFILPFCDEFGGHSSTAWHYDCLMRNLGIE